MLGGLGPLKGLAAAIDGGQTDAGRSHGVIPGRLGAAEKSFKDAGHGRKVAGLERCVQPPWSALRLAVAFQHGDVQAVVIGEAELAVEGDRSVIVRQDLKKRRFPAVEDATGQV